MEELLDPLMWSLRFGSYLQLHRLKWDSENQRVVIKAQSRERKPSFLEFLGCINWIIPLICAPYIIFILTTKSINNSEPILWSLVFNMCHIVLVEHAFVRFQGDKYLAIFNEALHIGILAGKLEA